MKKIVAAVIFGVMMSASSFAAEPDHSKGCWVHIKRDACPGKETAAFKPYNGEPHRWEELKKGKDEASCAKEAAEYVKIIRKGTLTQKTLIATLDNKPVEGGKKFDSGKAECK